MKKAQTSTMDFLIGLLLVTAGVILVSTFTLPNTQQPQIYSDVQTVAEAIFSPYPVDWNESTYIIPGFIVEHKINQTLFTQAQSFSSYAGVLGIKSNLYINTTLGEIGEYPPAESTDITRLSRYAAYNGEIQEVEVIVWQ